MSTIKKKLLNLIKLIPILYDSYRYLKKGKRKLLNPFLRYSPPGQYNSPLPDYKEVLNNEEHINRKENNCPGINLRKEKQLKLLEKLSLYSFEIPFQETDIENSLRYYYDNNYFRHADAVVLYSMLRHFKPQEIIEIGSGYSSAVMLDTNDLFLSYSTKFTFIEPFPDRLFRLLSEKDRINTTIIEDYVQNIDLNIFSNLNENDVLFIDSSHVIKVGSDLSRIFFHILPILKPGVIVHFHDIFWPFEYPLKWFRQGRGYNEIYALRSFLQFNNTYKIIFFPSYLYEFCHKELQDKMPMALRDQGGGSIYLKKIK